MAAWRSEEEWAAFSQFRGTLSPAASPPRSSLRERTRFNFICGLRCSWWRLPLFPQLPNPRAYPRSLLQFLFVKYVPLSSSSIFRGQINLCCLIVGSPLSLIRVPASHLLLLIHRSGASGSTSQDSDSSSRQLELHPTPDLDHDHKHQDLALEHLTLNLDHEIGWEGGPKRPFDFPPGIN